MKPGLAWAELVPGVRQVGQENLDPAGQEPW